jgi:hypothetical protein
MRRDALFDLTEALACRPERVHMLAGLCLMPECRHGHGGVYDAVNSGEVVIAHTDDIRSPDSSPALPAASPRPASAGATGASARICPFPPARRNPPGPAPAGRKARRTKGSPPATTSAKPSSAEPKKKTRRQTP